MVRLRFKGSRLNSPCLFCVTDQLRILASASVGSRHCGTANTLHAEARDASVSVAATVSHLPGLLASSSVIMTIYRPSPLVPDIFVPHFCYDEAQMSRVTHIWLLIPLLWLKRGEKETWSTWMFDLTWMNQLFDPLLKHLRWSVMNCNVVYSFEAPILYPLPHCHYPLPFFIPDTSGAALQDELSKNTPVEQHN